MVIGSPFFPSNFQDTDIGVVMSLLLRGLKGIRGGRAVLITPSDPTDPVRPTPWASTWKNVVFFRSFFYSALWHWYHIMIWSPVLSTIVPLPLFTLYIILNPQMDYTRRGGEGRIRNNQTMAVPRHFKIFRPINGHLRFITAQFFRGHALSHFQPNSSPFLVSAVKSRGIWKTNTYMHSKFIAASV